MTTDMQQSIKNAIEELDEWMQENPGNDEPHDRIFEIADGSVPVYTVELLEWAIEDIYLATDEPEIGAAFDGSPTPVNIIAANIFEKVEEALWEYYNNHKNDYVDEGEEFEYDKLEDE